MNVYNMKKITLCLLSALLTSCVVEYTPGIPFVAGGYYNSYSSRVDYSPPRHCYGYGTRLAPNVTPVDHGFSSSPQYVRGYVFRGGDGMLYAAEH
jgi:hypothetical protein